VNSEIRIDHLGQTTTSRYATHVPVLRFLIEMMRPERILEFGAGEFSTPLLLSSGAELTSIETSIDWLAKVCHTTSQHIVVHWPCDSVEDYLLDHRLPGFDLAFVDGPVNSRVPCVQRLFGRSRVIVIHDSMTRCYGWKRLVVPTPYRRFDYTQLHPATSVFAIRDADAELISDFCFRANVRDASEGAEE
jgi:hypothetical protein